ncbi:MAG: 2-oxo acid dehydrogenase subunit E2, partial [Chloroflexi bacterium]
EPPATQPEPAGPQTVPLAGMRAAIARRMHQSLQDMAQLTLHTEADVTELKAYRAWRKAEGVTYTDLLVRACALALSRHPRLNARLDGDRIVLLPDVHIGLAVALPEGLVVPVIRNAAVRSVSQIARERARLVDRARAGQLNANEMSGSTFTVTNLGMFDVDAFTPIVNPPEAAILGVGRIVEKVVIYKEKIAQRAMMTLSLSFDHRLVDGAPAAAFLQSVKQTLEEPATL